MYLTGQPQDIFASILQILIPLRLLIHLAILGWPVFDSTAQSAFPKINIF